MENSRSIKVDILVPAYKEPLDLIERILSACRLQNLENNIDLNVWLCVDGVNKDEENAINLLGARYKANISYRPNRNGFRAGALNYCIKNNIRQDTKYLIVLDVDHAPKPNMVKTLVKEMEKEENHNTHFVMFPQIAENSEKNAIAYTSDILQRYDYYFNRRIRAITNSAFVVGTNWICRADFIRRFPFEEDSIVEDQASSIKWHSKGAIIKVINAELALGLAPDTIDSWKAQQARWSYGALYNLKFLRKYWNELTFWQKIDYLSVMTWYLYAVPTVMSILMPLVTFFGPITLAPPILPIALLFVNIAAFTIPIIYCKEPHLTLKDIFRTAAVQHICLDLYLISTIDNMRGKKFSYVVSNKTGISSSNIHRNLWFSYFMVAITSIGIIYAIYLNPPTIERVINAFQGAPLRYTTYIIYWLLLGIFWTWGAIYYAHKSHISSSPEYLELKASLPEPNKVGL